MCLKVFFFFVSYCCCGSFSFSSSLFPLCLRFLFRTFSFFFPLSFFSLYLVLASSSSSFFLLLSEKRGQHLIFSTISHSRSIQLLVNIADHTKQMWQADEEERKQFLSVVLSCLNFFSFLLVDNCLHRTDSINFTYKFQFHPNLLLTLLLLQVLLLVYLHLGRYHQRIP